MMTSLAKVGWEHNMDCNLEFSARCANLVLHFDFLLITITVLIFIHVSYLSDWH